jgi:hypothetical protein
MKDDEANVAGTSDDFNDEKFAWESSPEFWRMIEERRSRPTIPLDKAKRQLFPEDYS